MKVIKKKSSIFSRIFITISILITCSSLFIGLSIEQIYKNFSYDSLSNSNYALLGQIDTNLTTLYSQLFSIVTVSDSSAYFRNLLTLPPKNQLEVFSTQMELHRYLSNFQPILDEFKIWITLRGANGIIYTTSKETFTADFNTISQESWFQQMDFNLDSLAYTLDHYGLNSATENKSMIIYAKNLINSFTMQSGGTLFLEIDSTSFNQMYMGSYLQDDYIFITDSQGKVISSSDASTLSMDLANFSSIPEPLQFKKSPERDYYRYNNKDYIAVKVPTTSFDGYIVKLIDLMPLHSQVSQVRHSIIWVTFFLILLSIVISFFVCKRISNPIKRLSYKMVHSKYVNAAHLTFTETNNEVEILTHIYDQLIQEIDQYTKNLVEQSKARRTAEFNALQMQINPHFLYNTLASIKFMVLQEPDTQKTANLLSSFISLLRNTISNPNEMITLQEELHNLENYIGIQNIRYEDGIEYQVICPDSTLFNTSIPKLLLQPLVENAIFHGLKDNLESGNITIYVSRLHENLKIEIIDNGCGMDNNTIIKLLEEELPISNKDYFSGIGVKNINNRIKLLYGQDYGITITSSLGIGTNIRLILPL